jgi:hypothetical protein
MGIGPRLPEWSGPLGSLGWEEFVVILPPGDPLRRGDAAVGSRRSRTASGCCSSVNMR